MAEDVKQEVSRSISEIGMSMVERLGLPTAFLLAFGWIVYSGLIVPIVTTAKSAIDNVAETNRMLEEQLRNDDASDAAAIRDVLGGIDHLGQRIDLLREAVESRVAK